jgi:hypothetical protein
MTRPIGISIPHRKIKEDDIQDNNKSWHGLDWGDMPVGQENNFDFMEGARWAEKQLKEKNN